MEIWNENLPPSSYSPFISYHSPNPSELLQFHSHYSHCHHSDILRPYYLTRKLQKHGSITSLSWKGLYILFIPTSSFYNKPRPKDFLMSPSRHWIAGLGLDPKFSNKCNALSLSLTPFCLSLLNALGIGLTTFGIPRLLPLKHQVLKLTSQKSSLTPQHLQDKLETSKSEIQGHA